MDLAKPAQRMPSGTSDTGDAVAFLLTCAQAQALFDAAALGLSKRAESGISGNDKVVDALQNLARQMARPRIKQLASGRAAAGARLAGIPANRAIGRSQTPQQKHEFPH